MPPDGTPPPDPAPRAAPAEPAAPASASPLAAPAAAAAAAPAVALPVASQSALESERAAAPPSTAHAHALPPPHLPVHPAAAAHYAAFGGVPPLYHAMHLAPQHAHDLGLAAAHAHALVLPPPHALPSLYQQQMMQMPYVYPHAVAPPPPPHPPHPQHHQHQHKQHQHQHQHQHGGGDPGRRRESRPQGRPPDERAAPPAPPPPQAHRLAFVNGRFLGAHEANVSITDFGFAYGCAIVEEILVVGGVSVRLDAHLEMLALSARALKLPLPLSVPDLRSICDHVVTANRDGPRAALFVQVSFGAYGTRSRHLPPPSAIVPSLVVHTQTLPPVPAAHLRSGVALFPAHDNRPFLLSASGEPSVPYVSSSQLPAVLALHTAQVNGCDEALLFDPTTGDVTGTTGGNIFCVKFGVIYTPPAIGKVSDGVMRRHVLSVCRGALAMDVREVSITRPFLCSATEVFCTSNLDQVVPVRAVGDRTIAGDVPGPVTTNVMAWIAAANAPPAPAPVAVRAAAAAAAAAAATAATAAAPRAAAGDVAAGANVPPAAAPAPGPAPDAQVPA